jgi:glyoxylase-like metal-dependent hydrolase (beta-lactamase superfamily II)
VDTDPDIYRLVVGANNVYALPDRAGLTLIDAGPDFEGSWGVLSTALSAHGFAPADVHTVVLTHHHLDHAGLAARWQAQGARVLAGRGDADTLAMDAADRGRERVLIRATLMQHGAPRELVEPSAAARHRASDRPSALRMTALQADGLLDDGDVVAAANRRLRVIACPGHTSGTVMLLDEAGGAAFTGDHILPRTVPTPGIQVAAGRRRPSLPEYLRSVVECGPRSVAAGGAAPPHRQPAYPGHGDPIADLQAAASWIARSIEQRARRLLAHLRRGPGTAHDIARRVYPRLDHRHLRPVMAETLGLLDLLAERGLARADDTGTTVIWSACG